MSYQLASFSLNSNHSTVSKSEHFCRGDHLQSPVVALAHEIGTSALLEEWRRTCHSLFPSLVENFLFKGSMCSRPLLKCFISCSSMPVLFLFKCYPEGQGEILGSLFSSASSQLLSIKAAFVIPSDLGVRFWTVWN